MTPENARGSAQAQSGSAAKELVDLFFTVAGMLQANFSAAVAHFGLTPLQARALGTLDPTRPTPMRALATELGSDASTVTSLVDRLEKLGYVERRPDLVDRRVKGLVVTTDGARTAREMFTRVLADAPPIARLDAREQAQLRSLLHKIVGDLGADAGQPKPPRISPT